MHGEPIDDVPIRLTVQARQVYSYAVAASRGWFDGADDLVRTGFASMVRDYHRRDSRDGWAFTIGTDGAVVDGTRDLYAQAFVLLAVAWHVKATGDRSVLTVADETLEFFDREMKAPRAGGFLEALPERDGPRRQNPHMHMFEGLLSLWSATGIRRYLDRATAIFELFRSHFFLSEFGVLGEYFDADLRPARGDAGKIVEPGHHYEWIWLLRWFERESGQEVQSWVDALYAHADRHGFDGQGLIADEVSSDGRVLLPSHRTWPVTEAIKANLVEAQAGRQGAAEKAAVLTELLLDRYLSPAVRGGWIDRLNERGRPVADFMPASTLYHVICAAAELTSEG